MPRISGKFCKINGVLQKAAVFAIIIYTAAVTQVFAQKVINPLKSEATSFAQVLKQVSNWVTVIAPYIAVIFVVVAGLQFLFAGESEQKISEAKKTLWWTLIGTAILVGASLLANAIINTVTNL